MFSPTPFRRWLAAGAGALPLLLAVIAPASAQQAAPPPIAIGRTLPDAVMTGLNGPHRTISSFRGRPLIVNVWASWCGPCRSEAASLERLAWSEAGSKYTVIGVSTDDYRGEAQKWLQRSNATLNHYIDLAPNWTLEHMFGASSIPVTVLVDASGRVVARFRGAREWDTPESIKLIEQSYAVARKSTAAR